MAGKTLTRADLSEAVHRQVGLSRTELAELVKSILDRDDRCAGGRDIRSNSPHSALSWSGARADGSGGIPKLARKFR